jgi:O-antigen/teichoic acid export membrane protein
VTTGVAPVPSASRAAARSVTAIVFNQFPQVAGSVLYVILIPRLLKEVVYGQLAFAYALIAIFQMLGELGYQEVFARFLPEVRQREGEPGVRALARRLLAVKVLVGMALGTVAGLLARLLGDWFTAEHAALVGLSVAVRIWAMGAFAVLLGLGHTAKWSVETTWRQIVVAVLTIIIARDGSLTLALWAMAIHEVLFLLLGLWWARRWVGFSKPDGVSHGSDGVARHSSFGIWPYLRFGFIFSLANLALVVMFRIGVIAVEKLTGRQPEAGFFDLAQGGLLLVYTFLGQVAYAFVPILTQLHLDEQGDEAEAWLGRFVRYAGFVAVLAAGGMWAVAGAATPLLFGPGYEPTADALRAIAFGLLPLPIAWAAVIHSTVEKRPAHKVRAALLGLGVFLAGAVALRAYASAGVALAFGLALAGYAAGFGHSAWRALRAGGAGWWIALGSALVFAPFLIVRLDSFPIAFGAWSIAAAAYSLVNLALRVIRLDEVRSMLRELRR